MVIHESTMKGTRPMITVGNASNLYDFIGGICKNTQPQNRMVELVELVSRGKAGLHGHTGNWDATHRAIHEHQELSQEQYANLRATLKALGEH